jgi:hypothetical protein
MNPLAALKEKLMVKPNVEERERVAVVIKGVKNERKPRAPKIKAAKVQEEKDEEEEDEEDKPISEKIILEQSESDEEEKQAGPLIVDETEKGYDREALIKKLMESKKIKVTVKPNVLISEDKKVFEPVPLPPTSKKVKKIEAQKTLIIEGDEGEEKVLEPGEEEEFIMKPKKKVVFEEEKVEESPEEFIMKPKKKEDESIQIIAPKKKQRLTEKPEKGVAILGPETLVQIGDTDLSKRLPKKLPPVIIKVSSYYMNNREIFINFINSMFEPYRQEIQENKESISCDTIGQTNTDFSLLTHQKIVRDYLNLYTPYRGLLLYHGLGSGKTCTSIAIAEGMKDSKRVIIMTPASLRANYIEELKKCGDLLYKRNQYWEWISTVENQEALKTVSILLNLPQEYIRRHGGAFFINVKKPSNYSDLSDTDKKVLEEQLNEMIRQKYTFINYNGLRSTRLAEMTSNYTRNIFDNSVVIIDEAHNLISRIVNKIKKEKGITGEEKKKKKEEGKEEAKPGEPVEESIFGEQTPLNLATKLYYMLLRAKNARVVLLTGTPVINYPNEFAILFNILRGYIKTWKIPLNVKTSKKIDKNSLSEMLMGEKSLDYIDYSSSSKILTVTRNPFGFKNKIKKESGYQGVSNVKKEESGELVIDTEFTSDDDFERKIISILKRNDIDVIPSGIQVVNQKALPDDFNTFMARYINENDKSLQNVDALKRRIIGLSSYFKSAQESLLPKYNKQLGVDYHIVRIPMSDVQFKIYESARKQERELEKKQKPKSGSAELFEEKASTYRIFSRLFCNYVMPDRPIPMSKKKNKEEEKEEEKAEMSEMAQLIKEGTRLEAKQDVQDEREGEIEGDEILEELGGTSYKERLDRAIKNIEEHSNDFLTPEALETYSPKFLHMLENIDDPTNHPGLHLVYSQFRTAEGIGIFSLVLEKNGFARFRIKKNHLNVWEIDIPEVDEGKPTYALYTGTETSEEKEMLRHIYNGEWSQIPESIGSVLKAKYHNNNMGEVIKVFMITSSGSEGINLRNTRYVHIMEPYWHPVRSEQVIGRARRICSHKDLPKALQTVEVFVYLMIFSESQLKSDEAIELKRKDLSKAIPRFPITSDQYLFEISEIKANLTAQLTDAVKESAFDCYIYSNGKCVNFGDPTNEKYAYVPDYAEQQNDTTVRANKVAIEWVGKPITINGVEYVYRRGSKDVLDLYDMETYKKALEDASIQPLKVGTYEINERGEKVLKLIT